MFSRFSTKILSISEVQSEDVESSDDEDGQNEDDGGEFNKNAEDEAESEGTHSL